MCVFCFLTIRQPQISTRTDTLCPYSTLVRPASARKGALFRRQDHRVRPRRPRLIGRLDEFRQQLPAEHIELLGMEQDDGGDAVIDRETEAIEHVRALRRW